MIYFLLGLCVGLYIGFNVCVWLTARAINEGGLDSKPSGPRRVSDD